MALLSLVAAELAGGDRAAAQAAVAEARDVDHDEAILPAVRRDLEMAENRIGRRASSGGHRDGLFEELTDRELSILRALQGGGWCARHLLPPTIPLLGQAGVLVALLTVVAAVVVERVTSGAGWRHALRLLGFGGLRAGRCSSRGCCMLLLGCLPVLAQILDVSLSLRTGRPFLAIGLFAQDGIAEETLFRGYLFRHLRVGSGGSFWRAAWLSLVPFTVIHLFLLTTLPLPVALLHFAAHAIKLVSPEAVTQPVQLAWTAAVALIPFLVLAFRFTPRGQPEAGARGRRQAR